MSKKMSTENPGIDNKSLTVEEFDEKYKPLLNTALDLMNTHQEIPDDVVQADVMGALIMMGNELSATLHNRVPEIVKLQDEIAKKDKTIAKLQDTNQQFFLKIGTLPDPNKKPEGEEKPKKSFAEIRAMIDRL
jgi:hypothetical protein